MVNHPSVQTKTVTDYMFHISSEKEQDEKAQKT